MKTIILAILDGWGVGQKNEINPIYTAQPETIQYIEEVYPAGALNSSGISVGLPWGEEGNSEVGHLTLGSGRVLYQHFLRITKSIEKGSFFNNKALKKSFDHAKQNSSNVHLVGLLTEGNVHASIEHIRALIKMASMQGVSDVYLHLFTDGKDGRPRSARELIKEIQKTTQEEGVGKLSTIMGRYWGMDRENHWDRTQKAYDALVREPPSKNYKEAIKETYKKDLNDNYIEPTSIEEPVSIEDGDSIIFFNFREDSMQQIVSPFADSEFNEFEAKKFNDLQITTMTHYNDRFEASVAFPPQKIRNTLGELLSKNKKNQMRVAETVKGAHVTYFFNGLKEGAFDGEYRVLIPSMEVGRIDQEPQMRAEAVTNRVLLSLQDGSFRFILVNYANPDVIAHTGNYNATVEAVRAVDRELNKLLRATIDGDHTMIITSDHGNAEVLFDPKTGGAETSHNPNPVPFYLVGNRFEKSNFGAPGRLPTLGVLSDIAPTVLDLMNINQPAEMTGKSLLDII